MSVDAAAAAFEWQDGARRLAETGMTRVVRYAVHGELARRRGRDSPIALDGACAMPDAGVR